jgi:hypothetical protein
MASKGGLGLAAQYDFGAGLNTSSVATEIEDSETADILNFQLDLMNNAISRPGTTKVNTTTFGGRITSLFHFNNTNGRKTILTTDNKVYKTTDLATWTDITGAATLPSNTYWQWIMFDGLALGAHRSSSTGPNLVSWDGGAGNIATATMTGYTGGRVKHIAVWNGRVFVVDTTTPNTLYFSQLGDSTQWGGSSDSALRGGAIEVGYDDGDEITGLYAYRQRLFIFKRHKIYYLTSVQSAAVDTAGSARTDPDSWQVELFVNNVGCVSQFTVQAVYDRLLFLSDSGLVAINASQTFGDFEHTVLSNKVPDMANINKQIDTFASLVIDDRQEYWLSVPKSSGGTVNDVVWCLNFAQESPRWTKYDGKVAGASYCHALISGIRRVIVGGYNDIYRFADSGVYSDNGVGYQLRLVTKDLHWDDLIMVKQLHDWTLSSVVFSDTLLTITYIMDGNPDRSVKKKYKLTHPATFTGAKYDVDEYRISRYAPHAGVGSPAPFTLRRPFKDQIRGNRCKSVQFKFEANSAGTYIMIRGLGVRAKSVGIRRTTDG